MDKHAKEVYERYKHKGNLIDRAIRILDAKGVKNNRGKSFSYHSVQNYVYSPKHEDVRLDRAIIEAAIEYEEEKRKESEELAQLAAQLEGAEN